jgi:hypothetical protein
MAGTDERNRTEASPASTGEAPRREWGRPVILSREPVEAVAAVCSPGGGGKETSPAPCPVFAQS